MTIRVAINGYGRIGRNILRAHYEGGKRHDIEIVAINDLGNAETNAHLTRYDTAHGRFNGSVLVDDNLMVVNGDPITVTACRNPAELPWKELGVDVVLDMVGGDYMARDIDVMAVDGRHVSIAFLQGSKVSLNMAPVMTKRLTLTGSTLRARPVAEKGRIAAALREHVWPLLESGGIKPQTHATFPLEQADEAHRLMESSAHIGKIVLTVGPDAA